MNDEPITIYSLMVDDTSDWTLGQISAALEGCSDLELIHGSGLAVTFAFAFNSAFGSEHPLTQQALGAMGAIGTEIRRRGQDPQMLNFAKAFDDWCASLEESDPGTENLPTHLLSTMRAMMFDAITRLSGSPVDQEAADHLRRTLTAVEHILSRRGVVAEDRRSEGFQA